MTGRPAGPDRWRSSLGHYAAVMLAVLLTIAVVIGTAAGPRAGLIAGALLLGLPCAAVVVLAGLCLAADRARTATHRRARRRAGLAPADVDDIEHQALAHLTRQLDQENRPVADQPCPACTDTRAEGHYLCRRCWGGLTPVARSQLNRRDGAAIDRLRQLLDQIRDRVPLAHITITTPPKD